MTHRTFGLIPVLTPLLLLTLATGCYHESYAYRAVPNVNVARVHDLGSEGPLVLISLDDLPKEPADKPKRKTAAQMLEQLNADQIARFDPRMADLNREAASAHTNLQNLKSRFGAEDAKVKEAQAASEKANKAVDDYVRDFKANNRNKITGIPGSPIAPVAEEPEAPQTVLVGNVYRDFGERGSSVSRTFVLFIDGAPKPGTYWMTNANSVLITYSAFTPPHRSRVAMVGSVKIIKVDGNKIDAHVSLRETEESDSYEWVTHYMDPAYWQAPWIVNGRHTFMITGKDDPALRKAAVEWVKPEELKAQQAAASAGAGE